MAIRKQPIRPIGQQPAAQLPWGGPPLFRHSHPEGALATEGSGRGKGSRSQILRFVPRFRLTEGESPQRADKIELIGQQPAAQLLLRPRTTSREELGYGG